MARSTKSPPGASATGPSRKKSASPGGGATATLEVGSPVPDFKLAADDGNNYSRANLRGQRYVLYFYPRDNTSGCTLQACDFRDNGLAFGEQGLRILGVSSDSLASHEKFRAKHNLSFPLLSDPQNSVATAFGAYGEKLMYGKRVQGVIRSTFVVDAKGKIEKIWSPVRTKGHAQAVLLAVTGSHT